MSEIERLESPGKSNFLGIVENRDSTKKPYFHIIPVAYDGTCSYRPGARFGPRAIIDASRQVELFDAELGLSPVTWGVVTEDEVETTVDPQEMVAKVESRVRSVLADNCMPVLIGGEHTVSLGSIYALAEEGLTVVCLDAHADLRDTYQGSRYSHACFLRRASERAACMAIGVRSMSEEERNFALQRGIKIIYAWQIAKNGIEQIDIGSISDRVYLSIDVDVFDPCLVPDVGTPEPGGLGWYEAVGVLEKIVKGREIAGFDVVELSPQLVSGASSYIVAKLIYRVMGLILKFSRNWEVWSSKNAKEKESRGN